MSEELKEAYEALRDAVRDVEICADDEWEFNRRLRLVYENACEFIGEYETDEFSEEGR